MSSGSTHGGVGGGVGGGPGGGVVDGATGDGVDGAGEICLAMATASFNHGRALLHDAFLDIASEFVAEVPQYVAKMMDLSTSIDMSVRFIMKEWKEEEDETARRKAVKDDAGCILKSLTRMIDGVEKGFRCRFSSRRLGLIVFGVGHSLTALGWVYMAAQGICTSLGVVGDAEGVVDTPLEKANRYLVYAKELIAEGINQIIWKKMYVDQERGYEAVPVVQQMGIKVDAIKKFGTDGDMDFLRLLNDGNFIHRELLFFRHIQQEQTQIIFGLGQLYTCFAWFHIDVNDVRDIGLVPMNNGVPLHSMPHALRRKLEMAEGTAGTKPAKKLVEIDIVSDTVCPWCFVGKKELDKAVEASKGQYDFRIRWHPYQHDPNAPKEGVDKRKYFEQKFGSGLSAVVDRMAEMFRSHGLEYDLSGLTGNSLDSHRLIYFVGQQDPAKQHDLVGELFLGYFTQAKYIGDREYLLECARKIDVEGAAKFLADPNNGLSEVKEDLEKYMGNITIVPHFMINNGKESLSGAQSPEDFLKAFEAATK